MRRNTTRPILSSLALGALATALGTLTLLGGNATAQLRDKTQLSPIRETLAHLEAALDARRFVRIHRSFIVNVGQIKELQPWFGGDAVLILKGGQQLKVSRTYRAQLKSRLNAL